MTVGDFVKGLPDNGYNYTNQNMTRGVVIKVTNENNITVKILDHVSNVTGTYAVDPKGFEVIGHVKEFNRDEVIELLRNGCKKALLDYDLTDADLTRADLTDADLTRANLTRADLTGADLTRADLTGANLTGADLTRADLTGANLTRADLTDADLTRANLTRADLTDADLTRADLTGANLTGADLTGANLTGADLTRADLTGANLTRADLTDADLTRANIDFSCWPLWCGSLHVKTDKRIACQLAYHLCSMQCDDAEYIAMRNSILGFANQFHRVGECGTLEIIESGEDKEYGK